MPANKSKKKETIPKYSLDQHGLKPKKKWKPKCGENVFYITAIGYAHPYLSITNSHSLFINGLFKFGNCFKTKEEAEAARDKVRELLRSL